MLNSDRIVPTAFASLDQALARLLDLASPNGFIRRCLQSCLVRERTRQHIVAGYQIARDQSPGTASIMSFCSRTADLTSLPGQSETNGPIQHNDSFALGTGSDLIETRCCPLCWRGDRLPSRVPPQRLRGHPEGPQE